jgi:opacity protein-like surface antigen
MKTRTFGRLRRVAGLSLAFLCAPIADIAAQDGPIDEGDFNIFVFVQDTTIDVETQYGIGMGFDYNLTDRWSVGATFGYSEPDYAVNLALTNGSSVALSGELAVFSMLGNVTRYFGNGGPMTFYLSGLAGFQYLDSNIPDGPATVGPCWWDPWWGYSCGVWQESKTSTEFSYGGAVGLRWSLSDDLFLDLNFSEQWIDFENAVSPGNFTTTRLAVGFRR